MDILVLKCSTDPKETGPNAAQVFSFFSIYWETLGLGTGWIFVLFLSWCCRQNYRTDKLEYFKAVQWFDLQLALLCGPFSHTHFFLLEGFWYIAVIIRLACYAVIFTSAVIVGMRIPCIICLCIDCGDFGCKDDISNVEIRNCKHLFRVVIGKLIPIALKVLTCSSALATYLCIGITQSFPVRVCYFTFSMLRGVTSLFSLGFSATFLRWEVLNEEEKIPDNSQVARLLAWLENYEPHTHGAFVFDIISYIGLIVLNIIILT